MNGIRPVAPRLNLPVAAGRTTVTEPTLQPVGTATTTNQGFQPGLASQLSALLSSPRGKSDFGKALEQQFEGLVASPVSNERLQWRLAPTDMGDLSMLATVKGTELTLLDENANESGTAPIKGASSDALRAAIADAKVQLNNARRVSEVLDTPAGRKQFGQLLASQMPGFSFDPTETEPLQWTLTGREEADASPYVFQLNGNELSVGSEAFDEPVSVRIRSASPEDCRAAVTALMQKLTAG